MKTILIFLSLIMVLPLRADHYATQAPEVSNDQWESHPEAGVAVAVLLKSQYKNNQNIYILTAYIKNTSNIEKSIFSGETAVRFFYKDENNVQHYLRDVPDSFSHATSYGIDPGHIVINPVTLTPQELNFVTSHLIQVECHLSDVGHPDASYTVISSPKQLYLTQ